MRFCGPKCACMCVHSAAAPAPSSPSNFPSLRQQQAAAQNVIGTRFAVCSVCAVSAAGCVFYSLCKRSANSAAYMPDECPLPMYGWSNVLVTAVYRTRSMPRRIVFRPRAPCSLMKVNDIFTQHHIDTAQNELFGGMTVCGASAQYTRLHIERLHILLISTNDVWRIRQRYVCPPLLLLVFALLVCEHSMGLVLCFGMSV